MNKSILNETATVAQIEFRVRCETLGRGEEVVLIRKDDLNMTSVSLLHDVVYDQSSTQLTPAFAADSSVHVVIKLPMVQGPQPSSYSFTQRGCNSG